jgi:hypothetical protein
MGPEVRGQVKSRATALVCSLFCLDTPDTEATVEEAYAFRKKRAQQLLGNRSFLYAQAWFDVSGD